MEYLKKRQNDPQYLKTVIAQREIIIQQEQRKFQQLNAKYNKLQNQYNQLQSNKNQQQQALNKQITNIRLALQQVQSDYQLLKNEKNQCDFLLKNANNKLKQVDKQHKNEKQTIKIQNESQKKLLNQKIINLQKTIIDLKKYYNIQDGLIQDKKKIIEDSNRDLKGFSNQKQQRLLIIQNQQLKNELQLQSKTITTQLDKNERLIQEIRSLKNDIQLHKQMESDLVKRSSLAQTVIKKLYKQLNQLKKSNQSLDTSITGSPLRSTQTDRTNKTNRAVSYSRQNSQVLQKDKQTQQINKLKFELANAKNYSHYMQNMQKVYSKKYQTLGTLMANYLQNLFYKQGNNNQEQPLNNKTQISINISELKNKDFNQWKLYQIEAIIHILFTHIKPYFSKSSLINFPTPKNINISFVQESAKQVVSLPKIIDNYEKTYQKQAKNKNRFKDIPLDISTKILRSNLRQWGSKVKYGNMPINKNQKSKSIVQQHQKSIV